MRTNQISYRPPLTAFLSPAQKNAVMVDCLRAKRVEQLFSVD